MLTEEIRGHITDVLALNGLSPSLTLDLVKSRVNGASINQLLAAAIAVLREQTECIDELAYSRECLEDELADLEAELEGLREVKP